MKEILESEEYINEREMYTIKSGKLSYLVFGVQVVNFVKFLLVFYTGDGGIPWWVIFGVNVLFDLLGVGLIALYFGFYYKQGRRIR